MRRELCRDDVTAIRAALLAFFDAAARPLPWRSTADPYAIWIAEVMAQQTRVDTVVPYYDRWMRVFPDIAALARAPIDDVLKAWEGLGYYSRARNLHAAAHIVRERHGGAIPATCNALRALPGIGEYTAGAIASIAFGARHAAIDGNVRRVLSRLLDHADPPAALLRQVATALVPPDRPGDFNQAMMELGATVCTPRAPACGRCPLAARCAARAAGTQADRPAARPRRPIPTIDVATAVLSDPDHRVLLVRRPAHGLLAGMWCFPEGELPNEASAMGRALDIARGYASPCSAPRPLGVVEHRFTHRRERYHCFAFDVTAPVTAQPAGDAAWVEREDRSLALPRAQQRIRALSLARC